MRPTDLLRLALRNASRSGIKALLCAGAVCIGICSVCTVRGIGGAAQVAIAGELDELGISGMVFYTADDNSISAEDVDSIEQLDGVYAAMPFFYKKGTAKFNTTRFNAALCGINEEMHQVLDVKLLYGRLPQRGDVASANPVVIVDNETALKIYKRENIVGKRITLSIDGNSASFDVIGVIRSQKKGLEALLGGSLPCIVYIPYTALAELGDISNKMVAVSCLAQHDATEVATSIQRKLKYQLGTSFSYENLNQYTDTIQTITSSVAKLISGVAAISIFVGGLGVMNAMVAVVDARIGEIGIWIALGARRWTIALCYLFEALCICLAGGLVGAGLSAAALASLQKLVHIAIPIRISDLAFGIAGAAACGMLFGILPALRAARMNPIDAIRTD